MIHSTEALNSDLRPSPAVGVVPPELQTALATGRSLLSYIRENYSPGLVVRIMEDMERDFLRFDLDELPKKPWQIYENILGLAASAGIERCAECTLAPLRKQGKPVTWETLQARYQNFMRHFPPGLIEASVCVLDFDSHGSAHYHLFLVFKEDISTGFNRSARRFRRVIERQRHWDSLPEHLQSLCRSLRSAEKANEYLKHCRSVFRERAAKAKFGRRVEVNPITTSVEAYAVYLAKKYKEFGFRRPRDRKGAQSVRYTRGIERVADPAVRSRFNKHIWEYYQGLKRIAGVLWFDDLMHMLDHWKGKAHYYFRGLVQAMIRRRQDGTAPLCDHALRFWALLAVPAKERRRMAFPEPFTLQHAPPPESVPASVRRRPSKDWLAQFTFDKLVRPPFPNASGRSPGC